MRKASQRYSKEEMAKLTMYSCAEPCAMCSGSMYWGNLGRLVYIGRESELKKATGSDIRNPTLDLPRIKRIAKVVKKAFTREQEQKFIDLCLADVDTYAPYIVCCLQGVRKGEMLALRPNDFCFKHNTLRIDESYDENYPDDLLPKNADSIRTMPMFNITRQVLLRYADLPQNERIFTMSTAVLGKRLEKLLKANDLPRMTMHELRHTFISRCHEKGIDEIIIQKWVGHAKGSRLTKAVYTHVADDMELNYIERMNGKAS